LLKQMGRLEEAMPLFEESVKIFRRTLGNDHPDVATSLNNIATLLNRMGRLEEAMPLYEEAEKIFRRTLGNAHPQVATALNNRALLLKQMSKAEEARHLGAHDQASWVLLNLSCEHRGGITAKIALNEEEKHISLLLLPIKVVS
jgi:tetratricopeptide (TPR) repeat protein